MLERLVVALYCAVLAFTSLLFFSRTRAIFDKNPWVVAFFSGLWLAILGVSLAFIVVMFRPEQGAETAICLNPDVSSYITATIVISLINDTLVFLAISWRLFRNSYITPTFNSGIRFLFFGEYLPVFSKVLFQDGQAYYLLAHS